jgi:hypothetical protein
MPLDHYVPQVHLRKFYSPMLVDRLYAIRKSNLATFTPNSKGVCAINDGSTNAYLREDRAVEEFLKSIEPNYNTALDKLTVGAVDTECIYTIAGFVAFVSSCAPAAMRIHGEPLKANLQMTAAILDAKGMLPSSPSSLGTKTLTELLGAKEVEFEVDLKYSQALGIETIRSRTARFGNFKWDILHNKLEACAFFTSDFPIAIEAMANVRVVDWIVPLSPNLAVRINADMALRSDDLSFRHFGFRSYEISRYELVQINRLLVRCAEDVVFYRDDRPWVRPFVEKNRSFHVEAETRTVAAPRGGALISSLRVCRTPTAGR